MVAKYIFLVSLIFIMNYGIGWCEAVSSEQSGNVKEQEQNSSVNAEEDPYKDVTWDKVLNDQKNQTTDLTVFHQKTKDADFYSVSSTGKTANAETAVVLPVDRRR